MHPITFDILEGMILNLSGRDDAPLLEVTMSILYFGCLRCGEICLQDYESFDKKKHVCLQDITFDDVKHSFILFLKRSKTDKYSDGISVAIGCSKSRICAYCSLKRFVQLRHVKSHRHAPLLCFPNGLAIKKSYLINATKLLVGLLGLDASKFAGHSYRAGAATSASVERFSEWEIQLLGRWESRVYSCYLRDPTLVASFAARLAHHHE